eukprot:jgi/Mesen1/1992/ME000147S01087
MRCRVAGIGQPKVPYVFLTNGGGVPEAVKAEELSRLLRVPVSPGQVILGHTKFRDLVDRYGGKRVLAVGKGGAAAVLRHYGFRAAVDMDEYERLHPHIDPLAPHKPRPLHVAPGGGGGGQEPAGARLLHCPGPNLHVLRRAGAAGNSVGTQEPRGGPGGARIEGVFVCSDPVDWGRDLQVLCDVLRSGGLPGTTGGEQPHIYFAADDFEYQAKFAVPRFGMGAFRHALQSLFERLTGKKLQYTSFGKPDSSAFQLAENALRALRAEMTAGPSGVGGETPAPGDPDATDSDPHYRAEGGGSDRWYMVGDNPLTDIRGANEAGPEWASILTTTGIHSGPHNHAQFPASEVVRDVEEAVDFILTRERYGEGSL